MHNTTGGYTCLRSRSIVTQPSLLLVRLRTGGDGGQIDCLARTKAIRIGKSIGLGHLLDRSIDGGSPDVDAILSHGPLDDL
jgi:hypothetical protein